MTDTPHPPDPDEVLSAAEPVQAEASSDASASADLSEPGDPVDAAVHAQVVAERDQYLDALQRLKAEFDNYRKRVVRDREAQHLAGVRDLCGDLLPVVDNLERALAATLGGGGEQIVAGVDMVRGQLASLLSGRGVSEIEAHASPFDPTVHEAVAQQPSREHDEGTVVHVLEKGYRIGEIVIRPAKVVVAAPPPKEQ